MKRSLTFPLLLLVAFVSVLLLLNHRKPQGHRVKDGVLDFSRQRLGPQGLISLEGTWRFREWRDGQFTEAIPVEVPGSWNQLTIDGKTTGARKIGRYELMIVPGKRPQEGKKKPRNGAPTPGPPTFLMPSPFGHAYQVRVNGHHPILSDGEIDFARSNSRPGYTHGNGPIPLFIKNQDQDTVLLTIDLANHHHHLGGLTAAPIIGLQAGIKRFDFWWTLPALFAASLLLGFGAFCLGLLRIFRGRKLLLYAALFGLVGIFRLFFSDAMPVRFLASQLPWNLVLTLRFLTIPLLAFFVGRYIIELFPGSGSGFRKYLTWGVVFLVVLVLLLPPFPKSYVLYLTQLYLLGTIIGVFQILIRNFDINDFKIRLMLVVAVGTASSVLVQYINFYGNFNIRCAQTYGLLFVTIGMAALVLRDVLQLNNDRAQLTAELQKANHELSESAKSLEQKVVQRTEELAARNLQLESLQRFRKRTTAMIVHDLKTPLQVILSRTTSSGSNDQLLHAAGRRMLMMIRNILDVDRADRAELIVRPEALLLAEMVRSGVEHQLAFAREKGITLTADIDADLRITADRILTERILDNILHNAVKYSPQNGWVKLHASREDNFLILYCDDSGPGVSVEVRERIFTPYVTDQADTDAYGLGLSFVNAAMQAIGGRIEAPTPPVGTGGRFALYFPAVTTTETRPTSLSEVDHLMLASYISQLRETPFYAATELEVLLDQIPETGSLPDWKRAVRKAMYAGDRAGFEALLK